MLCVFKNMMYTYIIKVIHIYLTARMQYIMYRTRFRISTFFATSNNTRVACRKCVRNMCVVGGCGALLQHRSEDSGKRQTHERQQHAFFGTRHQIIGLIYVRWLALKNARARTYSTCCRLIFGGCAAVFSVLHAHVHTASCCLCISMLSYCRSLDGPALLTRFFVLSTLNVV